MIRRMAIALIAAAFFGLLGFVFVSWRPAIAPIESPNAASFTAESVAKGEALAATGHCVSCHTRQDGQPFAGGYGINTPFGMIYGSNITLKTATLDLPSEIIANLDSIGRGPGQ